MERGKHLDLDKRSLIARGLSEGKSFKAIASEIGKDCTTVSKEVRRHFTVIRKGIGNRAFNDCRIRKYCSHRSDRCSPCTKTGGKLCRACGECIHECPYYEKEVCLLLSRPPYVCNGCAMRSRCALEQHLYDPLTAQRAYTELLSRSRSGFNITEEELAQLDRVISPLLRNGQSIHHILRNNQDRINCCERTAYIYADHRLFEAGNIDMPRKVRFRPRKKKSVPLKVDKACRIGRTYEDFAAFRNEHPHLPVVELDTVEGIKGGAVLLTIHSVLTKLQLAYRRDQNDARSVTETFNMLYRLLGPEEYRRLFPILLCDNGTEFSDPRSLEFAPDGTRRSHVFYCHPRASYEKGHCENNHGFIRRVIPKGTDITPCSQADILLMMNHINNYGRADLEDRTPYAVFRFYYGTCSLDKLGIRYIRPNDVVLRPSLLKRNVHGKA